MDGISLEFLKYQENPAGFNVPRHNHACHELVYYLTGCGSFTLGDMLYSYGPGSFALIPPQLLHDEHTHLDSQLLFIGFTCAQPVPLNAGLYMDFDGQFVLGLLRQMQEELAARQPYHAMLLNNLTGQLALRIARKFFAGGADANDHNVTYIQKYIEEHFTERLTPRELAQMSGYSYDWFRHIFSEKAGCSLSQYIQRQKLRHAAALLQTTQLPVTQIALESQFSSASQFIALFHRQYGVTPRAFRRKALDKQTVSLTDV